MALVLGLAAQAMWSWPFGPLVRPGIQPPEKSLNRVPFGADNFSLSAAAAGKRCREG